ncbi:hypothetical protein SAMN05660284_02251 [Formivibrio citricus]|uniref:PilZ domain-containing protein n=1 Tax=Formivibrio citricus TaxID=83765 RepID=A0A1I5BUN5_9NEIS|nr:hypothetical protein [Formivibrio citricus]SFN78383.1 hypothetical protein SAMN05660284_02251 [Formivibrio citricus]
MFDIAGLISSLFGRDTAENGVHNYRSATRMLQALPESDMLMAQVEIVKALQQLNQNNKTSANERFKTIPYLDEKARALQMHLVGVYHGKILDQGAPLPQVLLTITSFWLEMGNAYQICLKQAMQSSSQGKGKPLALFTLRSMAYYFEHARWNYSRYMEMDSKAWRHINRMYLFAEQQGFASTPLQPYADTATTTIGREYLKILMLSLTQPEKIQPDQIELTVRWLEQWVDQIELETIFRPHRQLFSINLAGSSGPKRLRRDMVGENWRYWFTDALTQHIRDIHTQLANGTPPATLGLPEESRLPANLALLQKLGNLWSRDVPAPSRRHERRATKKSIHVIRGLESVIKFLQKHPQKNANPDLPAPDPGSRPQFPTTQWNVENESANGLGVQFHCTSDLKLRAGDVVGVQAEDQSQPLSIGIVRRICNRKDGKVSAGIETISTAPILVELRSADMNHFRAIFAPENPAKNQGRFLLIPQHSFEENREYLMSAQNRNYRIRLAPAREHAANATLAGFSVLAKLAS